MRSEKLIDMAGQRFGRLTVLSLVPSELSPYKGKTSRQKPARWLCRCDCGKEVVAIGARIRTYSKKGRTLSCGCYNREMSRLRFKELSKKRRIELSGTESGFLRYIDEAGFDGEGDGAKRLIKCLCACGKTITITATSYINNTTKSCGCLQKQIAATAGRASAHDLTGKRFGRLVAKSRVQKENSTRTAYWLCSCDCGNEKVVSAANLKRLKVKSCGCWMRELASAQMTKRHADLGHTLKSEIQTPSEPLAPAQPSAEAPWARFETPPSTKRQRL